MTGRRMRLITVLLQAGHPTVVQAARLLLMQASSLHHGGVCGNFAFGVDSRRELGETLAMAKETSPANNPQAADQDLVARCVRGDTAAFQELTVRYYRPVTGFIYKRVGQADLVEDLVQETFLEALRSLKGNTRPEHFSSWLFGIAHNRCGKWFRRKRPALFPATEPPADLAVPSFVTAQEELEEQQKLLTSLDKTLAGLPDETQRLLELKHRRGKTCEQIATELGQPVGTIKSQLSRAYKTLRERLSVRE
jgi:RNA polymerase sigma-70 factor (ECF subfamily)